MRKYLFILIVLFLVVGVSEGSVDSYVAEGINHYNVYNPDWSGLNGNTCVAWFDLSVASPAMVTGDYEGYLNINTYAVVTSYKMDINTGGMFFKSVDMGQGGMFESFIANWHVDGNIPMLEVSFYLDPVNGSSANAAYCNDLAFNIYMTDIVLKDHSSVYFHGLMGLGGLLCGFMLMQAILSAYLN